MKRVDEKTFISAYDSYADAIYRYCYFKVYDRERARELMQETFFKAWEYLQKGKEIENLRAFLYRTAHNLCVNEVLKNKPLSLDEMRENIGYDPEDHKQVSPEREGEAALMMTKLAGLADNEREVLQLRYVEGLPVKDIADALGEAPNTISVRIHRALARLKEEMGEPKP